MSAPEAWRVRLVLTFTVAGPESADEAAAEAARLAFGGELDPMWDCDCQVFAVQEDGTESGPFFRTSAYVEAIRSLKADAEGVAPKGLPSSESLNTSIYKQGAEE